MKKKLITANELMKYSIIAIAPQLKGKADTLVVLTNSTGFPERAYTITILRKVSRFLSLYQVTRKTRYVDAEGMREACVEYYKLTGITTPIPASSL